MLYLKISWRAWISVVKRGDIQIIEPTKRKGAQDVVVLKLLYFNVSRRACVSVVKCGDIQIVYQIKCKSSPCEAFAYLVASRPLSRKR